MDDDDEREFSKGIVYGFFEQADSTFEKMEKAMLVLHPLPPLFARESAGSFSQPTPSGGQHIRTGCHVIILSRQTSSVEAFSKDEDPGNSEASRSDMDRARADTATFTDQGRICLSSPSLVTS